MECIVEGAEGHDEQAEQQSGLQKGEDRSEKLVEPSQHYKFEHTFQSLSDYCQNQEYHYENQSKCYKLQDLFRRRDVL